MLPSASVVFSSFPTIPVRFFRVAEVKFLALFPVHPGLRFHEACGSEVVSVSFVSAAFLLAASAETVSFPPLDLKKRCVAPEER